MGVSHLRLVHSSVRPQSFRRTGGELLCSSSVVAFGLFFSVVWFVLLVSGGWGKVGESTP